MKRIVVVGTGTDVGKTHVVECLLVALRAEGTRALAWKPIATGVEVAPGEDTRRHEEALGTPCPPPLYAYRRGISAHLAAREESRAIDLAAVRVAADRIDGGIDGGIDRGFHSGIQDGNNGAVDVHVIETAGGLFSPIDDRHTQIDLVHVLAPAAVLVVAADRLGVLHDVRALKLAAATQGLADSTLVLSSPAAADASTGHNAAELDRLGLGPVAAVFPRTHAHAAASQAAAQRALRALVRR